MPSAGEQFEGKTVTAVYTGIETKTYNWNTQPWRASRDNITTATVVDDGIRPKSTAYWFYCCKNMTSCDLSKLDISKVTTASSMFSGCSSITTLGDLSGWDVSKVTDASYMFDFCSSITTLGDLSGWDVSSLKYAHYMFTSCSNLILDCSKWDVYKVRGHNGFNTNAPGVILPLAWQASSDEDGEDSAIAPLCEEQGNRDALRVSDENGNDKAVSKTDGETSADSETEGSNTASATDEAGAKEEEASDDIAQEDPIAA